MSQLLFSLLLVFLPTQLGYHFWPDWALVLGRRIDYLSPTLYATDMLIVLLLVSWLIEKKIHIYSCKKIFRSAGIKIVCFLLFIFLNIYFAANRMVAVFAWIKILELVALGMYIVQTKPKLSHIIFPLSVGVLYSSGIAIIQFLLQRSIGGVFWILGERTFSAFTPGIARIDFTVSIFNVHISLFKLRSYATFPHPNVLGGFLAILLPLIVTELRDKKKIFYFITIILGIIALVLTFSRSAWIAAAISSVYLIYKNRKRFFVPVVLMAISVIFFIGNTFGFQDESVVIREQLNTAAMSMFRASPFIGNGLGNFLVQLPAHLVSRTIYFLQPVHNIYLLLLSETGIIGLALFLWVAWNAVKNMVRHISPIHVSFCLLLLLGLVDHYPLTLQQGQLLFTIFLSLSLIQ